MLLVLNKVQLLLNYTHCTNYSIIPTVKGAQIFFCVCVCKSFLGVASCNITLIIKDSYQVKQ